jgi:beta-glucosidase
VIGTGATQFVTGGGSGNVTPFHFVSLLAGIRSAAGRRVKVTYDDGTNVAAALADAKAANVAIVAASDYYTEGADRPCLTLECPNTHGDQDGLIAQVAAANKRTVVVLESGGPDLTPWRKRVGALLEAWYPGGPDGPAIAAVLFGHADPGGRLPVTFPNDPAQIPTAGDPAKYPGIANNVSYKEGVLTGYRWYDTMRETPAFPFGFGLSYTSFRFGGLKIRRLGGGADRYRMTLTVTNTGRRRGWAVPELYVGIPAAPGRTEPLDELAGFAKLSLAPRQHRRVAITLDPRSFSFWDTASQSWRVAPGCDAIRVGSSSRQLPLHGRICPR